MQKFELTCNTDSQHGVVFWRSSSGKISIDVRTNKETWTLDLSEAQKSYMVDFIIGKSEEDAKT